MDRKVVMLSELSKLQNIATLSAITVLEFDQFIKLAMTVEQYIQNQGQETFDEMCQSLGQCMVSFPRYHESRQALLTTLMDGGFIKIVNKDDIGAAESEVEDDQPDETTEEIKPTKNNVINLFDRVDKPK